MASTASNVFAARPRVTGALRAGPLSAPAPTDAQAEIDEAYDDLGYIGEDGFTETISREVERKRAFGGALVKVLQTEFGNQFQFVVMESMNAAVLKRVYGAENVIVDGANITVRKNAKPLDHEKWIIDTEDGKNLLRTYVADGQVSEIGDIVRVHTDTIAYELTLDAFETEELEGDTSRDFIYVGALDVDGGTENP